MLEDEGNSIKRAANLSWSVARTPPESVSLRRCQPQDALPQEDTTRGTSFFWCNIQYSYFISNIKNVSFNVGVRMVYIMTFSTMPVIFQKIYFYQNVNTPLKLHIQYYYSELFIKTLIAYD